MRAICDSRAFPERRAVSSSEEENSDDEYEELVGTGASSGSSSPRKGGSGDANAHASPDGFHITRKGVDAKRFPNVASYNLEDRSKKELKQLFAAANKKAEAVADSTHIRRLTRAEGSREMALSIEESRRAHHYKQLEKFHLELRPSANWRHDGEDEGEREDKTAAADSSAATSLLTSVSAANIIERKREAADVLLVNQLHSETLPERLLKNNEKITKVQLAEESPSFYNRK